MKSFTVNIPHVPSKMSYLEKLYKDYINSYRTYIASHPRYEDFINLALKYSKYKLLSYNLNDWIKFVDKGMKEGAKLSNKIKFENYHEFILSYNHDAFVKHLYDNIVFFYKIPKEKLKDKKTYLKIMELYGYYAFHIKVIMDMALNVWFNNTLNSLEKSLVEAVKNLANLHAITYLHRIVKYYQIPVIAARFPSSIKIDPNRNMESDVSNYLEQIVNKLIQTDPYYRKAADHIITEIESFNQEVEEEHPELKLTEEEIKEEVTRRIARELSLEDEEEIES